MTKFGEVVTALVWLGKQNIVVCMCVYVCACVIESLCTSMYMVQVNQDLIFIHSLGEGCSHVGAVLLKVEEAVMVRQILEKIVHFFIKA